MVKTSDAPQQEEGLIGVFIRLPKDVRRAINVGAARRDLKPAQLARKMMIDQAKRMGLMKELAETDPAKSAR